MKTHLALLVVFLSCCCGSCDQPKSSFQLPRRDLRFGGHTVRAEVASTPDTMQNGLMFRTALGRDEGMLFIYAQPRQASFWMKNTKIPLSIGFIDSKGVLLEIRDMQPLDEKTIQSASMEVRYALEVNQGWFTQAGVKPGIKVTGLP